MQNAFIAVLKRELRAYFLSPLAYVFLAVYVLVTGLTTWNLARFFDTAMASLTPFFQFQPWLFAIFIPAIGMRLWSEDLRLRTADLYFTSGRPLWLIHGAKLCAGLVVLFTALILTLPYWIAVNYLGPTDNGVILTSYVILFGIGLTFLSVTLLISALTGQQVIAFVLSTLVCFALLTLGLSNITGQLSGLLPPALMSWLQGFSLLDVFIRALRGVLKVSDVIFILTFAALIFSIGVYALNQHRRRGQKAGLPYGALAFALLLLSLPLYRNNLDALTSPLRMDVTGYRLNTLSPSAKSLVRNLEEPISLTLYYNEGVGRDYPEIRAHAERTNALLDAFIRASNGNLTLTRINPAPFSSGEDLAISDGVEAVPTEGLDPLYFGLSGVNLIDDRETIAFLNPELDATLEFEIASLISRLDRPDLPKIGLLSGIPALTPQGGNGYANRLISTLNAGFDIEWLSSEMKNIPDDVEALILISPDKLSEYAAYQIDQFLMRKGRLIILTDPAPLMSEAQPLPETLTRLLESYGVAMSTDILADNEIGLPVNTGQRVETQPLYPGPGPANRARDDFLVSRLDRNIHFGGAGWVMTDRLGASSLIFSGETPTRIAPADLKDADLSPAGVRALSSPMSDRVSIALRLSGAFSSAFKTGAPDPELPDDPVLRRIETSKMKDRPHLKSSRTPGEIILIADTDFLMDPFYVNPQTGEPQADNEALILSILDQFAGRPELAALRARPEARRPMTRLLSLRAAAEESYLDAQDKAEADIAAIEARILGPLSEAEPAIRAEYLNARETLRDLQRAFRSQINALEAWLRLFTIWLPFALAIFCGLAIHFVGRRAR